MRANNPHEASFAKHMFDIGAFFGSSAAHQSSAPVFPQLRSALLRQLYMYMYVYALIYVCIHMGYTMKIGICGSFVCICTVLFMWKILLYPNGLAFVHERYLNVCHKDTVKTYSNFEKYVRIKANALMNMQFYTKLQFDPYWICAIVSVWVNSCDKKYKRANIYINRQTQFGHKTMQKDSEWNTANYIMKDNIIV